MAGRKGMKHYPESFKLQIKAEHAVGASLHSLCRKYGMSFYSAESWCGLRPEVNRRQMADGATAPISFTREGERLNLDTTVGVFDPVILILK